ncbi:hypothetical protein WR25_14738 isoform E [Diploscapter pachys]|uniref:Aldehyde dehydrogenase domain-containing protein n=1 Tax=Diploscapter pachys TaxID=2018661 RepID=A0A2A2JN07_9BILA|nr:hypothetical protein WR25_14738 isoform B [Diploscapter pachys]PAV63060.1 hypothetical protein WR25_14738 isoform E [Diploscapter pachys]
MSLLSAGDILFFHQQSLQNDDFSSAVSRVAIANRSNQSITHTGIVSSSHQVIHALPSGVKHQSLEEAISESEACLVEVTSFPLSASAIQKAIQFAESCIGSPYNDIFAPDCRNSQGKLSYYCSQLITESYKDCGVEFPDHKLNFKDKKGDFIPFWEDYFSRLKRPLPQGDSGSHPSTLRMTAQLQLKSTIRSAIKGNIFPLKDSFLETLHFIGGQTLKLEKGQKFEVLEPRNAKLLCSFYAATSDEIATAVEIAKKAQISWQNETLAKRGSILQKAAEIIKENYKEIAEWECRDNGKPICEAEADVLSCVDTFQYYAGTCHTLLGQHIPLENNRYAYTKRVPLGVVGCIGAWNYPLQTCSWKTAPALACGNSVVYKPSPLCPVTAHILALILRQSGLPDGVFNVVQGGAETGKALVEHKDVAKVSFTGSLQTGKAIMQSCAAYCVKPITLELGGKSALIVSDDVDIEEAVACIMAANYYSQGQVCTNASKVLVHRSIIDKVEDVLKKKTLNMKIGDPLDVTTKVGAHVSAEHRDKVQQYVRGAVKEGARLVCGGERVNVPECENGFYLSPCILAQVTEAMTVYR